MFQPYFLFVHRQYLIGQTVFGVGDNPLLHDDKTNLHDDNSNLLLSLHNSEVRSMTWSVTKPDYMQDHDLHRLVTKTQDSAGSERGVDVVQ